MVNPKLLMLKGLPASGKTTFARELVTDGWVRVNKDDLRAMFHNSQWSKENEGFILEVRDEVIYRALRNGKNVVVDDTNFHPSHEQQLSIIADDMMADFSVKFFDVPLDECLRRNTYRDKPVPEKVIRDMYNKHIKKEVTVEYDDNKEEAIIVDVDGTLAHIVNGRSPYDGSRALEDAVDDAVSVITAMAYGHGYKVIIVTGRSAEHKQVTEEWLEKNGIPYDEIYTRASGDNTKDSIVKEALYRTHIEPRYNVKFVLDDRQQVVDMWRGIGLKCLQVAEGNF